jgi:hypothetical protein
MDDRRATSCYCCASPMPPCGWCELHSRECPGCGAIVDEDDECCESEPTLDPLEAGRDLIQEKR